MNHTRPLTKAEEHRLVRYARRRLAARDRTIIVAVLFAGLDVAELRRLRFRDVYANGRALPTVTLPSSSPRSGGVCAMPITPEFARSLAALSASVPRDARADNAPLIAHQGARPLSRKGITRVIQRAIRRCGIRDDRQLGSGSLRKRFAEKVWKASKHNMLVLREALRVWSVIQAMAYLDRERSRVEFAMRQRYRVAA